MPNYILLPNGDFVNKDELYHYGIKGMKWGVRRYQNADGTLTAAGKKRISNRRPDDIVIEKGTQLNNVGSKEKLKLRGSTQATFNPLFPLVPSPVIPTKRSENDQKLFVYKESNKHDKDVYEGAFTKYIKYRDFTNTIFKQKFENINDLVSPSAQRRAELFVETYRKNPTLYSKLLTRTDEHAKGNLAKGVDYSPGLRSFIGKTTYDKNTSDADLKRYGYGLFNMGNEWTDPLSVKGNNKYYKTLKKNGYNALIDDNNAKIYNDAHEPIIVLNAKRYLKNIGNEKLTQEYMSDAENRLRDYMEKKYGDRRIAI